MQIIGVSYSALLVVSPYVRWRTHLRIRICFSWLLCDAGDSCWSLPSSEDCFMEMDTTNAIPIKWHRLTSAERRSFLRWKLSKVSMEFLGLGMHTFFVFIFTRCLPAMEKASATNRLWVREHTSIMTQTSFWRKNKNNWFWIGVHGENWDFAYAETIRCCCCRAQLIEI